MNNISLIKPTRSAEVIRKRNANFGLALKTLLDVAEEEPHVMIDEAPGRWQECMAKLIAYRKKCDMENDKEASRAMTQMINYMSQQTSAVIAEREINRIMKEVYADDSKEEGQ